MKIIHNPTPAKQTDATFQSMIDYIYTYMEERDWHTQPPRGLAVSILLEAGELLEHYQWQETSTGTKDEVAEELADILIYIFTFAMSQNIDMPAEIYKKLEKSATKFPAIHFKGKSDQEKETARIKAKLAHKKQDLYVGAKRLLLAPTNP